MPKISGDSPKSWGGEEKQVMVPEPEKATHDGI